MVRFQGNQIPLDRTSVPIFRIKRLHEFTAEKFGENSVFQNKLPHLSISVQQLRRRRKTMHVQNREGRAHKMGVTSKCNKSVAVLSL